MTPKVYNSCVVLSQTVYCIRSGTPSLAEPKTFGAVLEMVSNEARLAREAEISMEINPTSIETNKMR